MNIHLILNIDIVETIKVKTVRGGSALLYALIKKT